MALTVCANVLLSPTLIMTRGSASDALFELRSPSSVQAQLEALKQLKNEIVGHDQRKELIIRNGVVLPLVRILDGGRRKGPKRRRTETNGHKPVTDSGPGEEIWTLQDEVRLEAIMVAGSLSFGTVTRKMSDTTKSSDIFF